eukprot:2931486-Pyramimonas_sp.AAC.1
MACYDQLIVPDVAVAELAAHSLQLNDEKYRDRLPDNAHAETSDSHLYHGTDMVTVDCCGCPLLQEWTSAELGR